jgi:hypothetical protein
MFVLVLLLTLQTGTCADNSLTQYATALTVLWKLA